jgi:integrase
MLGQPSLKRDAQKPGTLRWLFNEYRKSSTWRDLSVATRRQRENIFRRILETSGEVQFEQISRKHIVEGRERRKDTPAMANNFVKAMRGLFGWAVEMEFAMEDPTRNVGRLKVRSEGIHTWTEDEIERFEAHWPLGTRERVAFDVLLYTGLRRGDAVRLGRQHVGRDGIFRIRTEKTGTEVNAPILQMLEASLKAGPTGDLSFIVGERGQPMVKESFGTWFRKACIAAGVPGSAHGLRKAAATRLANNGATVSQLEAIFGWSGGKMASLYTRAADRTKLATDAMPKLIKERT